MGRRGHHMMGLASGMLSAAGFVAFTNKATPFWILLAGCFLAIVAGILGGNAPDDLEFARAVQSRSGAWIRHSLIRHRTITHWWPIWAALAWFGAHLHHPLLRISVLSYVLGAVSHLIADIPNPTGIPIWTPLARSRKSLRWWKSGAMMEVPAAFMLCVVASLVFAHVALPILAAKAP